ALYNEGLALARDVRHYAATGRNLIGLARVAADEGYLQRAAGLFAAAESWLNPGVELEPFERAEYAHAVEEVRGQLGEAAFAAAWDAGRSATDAQPRGADTPVAVATPTASVLYPNHLTPREVEVLRLVAQGLT